MQNVNKGYVIFLNFRNFIVKSDQKPKTKTGMNEKKALTIFIFYLILFTTQGVIFYLYILLCFCWDMGVILILQLLHVWCISLFETKWLRHVFNCFLSICHKKLDTYFLMDMNEWSKHFLNMFETKWLRYIFNTFHSIHREKLDKNLRMDMDEYLKNF